MSKLRLYWDLVSPTLGVFVISIAVFFIVGMILSIPLCILWNWLMPFIFGLPKLSLFQTFGLSVLITLLSPRKIGFDKKENIQNKEYEKTNRQLEDLLREVIAYLRDDDIFEQYKEDEDWWKGADEDN